MGIDEMGVDEKGSRPSGTTLAIYHNNKSCLQKMKHNNLYCLFNFHK